LKWVGGSYERLVLFAPRAIRHSSSPRKPVKTISQLNPSVTKKIGVAVSLFYVGAKKDAIISS